MTEETKKDPKAIEAMGKALVKFGKEAEKTGSLDKGTAKTAKIKAAKYFIDAAAAYSSKNKKKSAKKDYKIAKQIINSEISEEKETPIKKHFLNIDRIMIVTSILSILVGILSIILNVTKEVSFSPGMSITENSNLAGTILIIAGIFIGIAWLIINKKKNHKTLMGFILHTKASKTLVFDSHQKSKFKKIFEMWSLFGF